MIAISDIVLFGPMFVGGLTALVGIRMFFINAPQPIKMLAQLWIVYFTVELIGLITSRIFFKSNDWLYNLWYLFSFLYLASIYFKVLERELVRISIQVFYVLFSVFVIINSLFIQGMFMLQTLTYVVGGVFIIYLSVTYFWALLVSPENERITRDPFFWLSFGLIIYFGSTVPFYGMFNYLAKNFFDFTEFYIAYISSAFFIFLNILVIVAFLCKKNYPK